MRKKVKLRVTDLPKSEQLKLASLLQGLPYDPFERKRETEKFLEKYYVDALFLNAIKLTENAPKHPYKHTEPAASEDPE